MNIRDITAKPCLDKDYCEGEFCTDYSFNNQYQKYYMPLVIFAKGFGINEDVAEDLVQEIFMAVWEHDNHFVSEVAFTSYLYTSVKNRSLDYLRHQEVESRHASYVHCNAEADLSEEFEDSFERAFDEELMQLLFREIDKLAPRCRQVFLLHLDGLSNQEIADQLDLSVYTVKAQNRNAMKVLREHFSYDSKEKKRFFLFFLQNIYPF